MSVAESILYYKKNLSEDVVLVAVSKTKPIEAIEEAYEVGQRIFGENKVQEMVDKYERLPKDIYWHMIGHMQSNKVKYIAPFVSLIHGVDSLKLLHTIDKEGKKNNRIISCLLQVHIAKERTKFGFDEQSLKEIIASDGFKNLTNIQVKGLMGMATFTDDEDMVRSEFRTLKRLFDQLKNSHFKENRAFDTLSMGMSNDHFIAIEEGSTMVRIGSSIFGSRIYP